MIGNFHQNGFILLPMYWLELSLLETNFKSGEHCFVPECASKESKIKI
jgi:hypothetical protein